MQSERARFMRIMLIGVLIILGGIFLYKAVIGYIIGKAMKGNQAPVITVSAQQAKYQEWQPTLSATGSIRAVKGVDVTTELAGMVKTIHFKPGSDVTIGQLLVDLNIDSDVALLDSLNAKADLAQIVYNRDKAQYEIKAISKAIVDTDEANLKSAQADVAEQAAIIDKKIIRAPFAGHLGVSAVNPGQYLNPGNPIVTLQALSPIYVDFYLPQQNLVQIKAAENVQLSSDTYPNETFTGKITTINPKVDVNTRNIEVEATLLNQEHKLLPGMFAQVKIYTGKPQRYLTLSQAAISYNPYGSLVYIIKTEGKDAQGKPVKTVSQNFVTTGATRGDQVEILTGIKENDWVVTSGQLKLKNGSRVVIDNKLAPSDSAAPNVAEQ